VAVQLYADSRDGGPSLNCAAPRVISIPCQRRQIDRSSTTVRIIPVIPASMAELTRGSLVSLMHPFGMTFETTIDLVHDTLIVLT
jgi:hypothetical protein